MFELVDEDHSEAITAKEFTNTMRALGQEIRLEARTRGRRRLWRSSVSNQTKLGSSTVL